MPDNRLSKYLQPAELSTIASLELVAKLVVEGFITGLHKSPFHGFSVEFSQHRPYMPGDSLRFIDWKVLGRTNRYYIKQYEEETNLRAYILLDISRSMLYGSGAISKARYAAHLAAALAYLFMKQRDATGLVLFDERIRSIFRPRSVFSYLPVLLKAIEQAEFGNDTKISPVLHQIAEQFTRRGLVILISDLLDEPQDVLAGLKHFRHDQHEIMVFHIYDQREMDLNFSGDVIFEDLENGQKIRTQPGYIRKNYQQAFNRFLEYYKRECSNNQISYQLLNVHTPYHVALTEFLLKRKRLL